MKLKLAAVDGLHSRTAGTPQRRGIYVAALFLVVP